MIGAVHSSSDASSWWTLIPPSTVHPRMSSNPRGCDSTTVVAGLVACTIVLRIVRVSTRPPVPTTTGPRMHDSIDNSVTVDSIDSVTGPSATPLASLPPGSKVV